MFVSLHQKEFSWVQLVFRDSVGKLCDTFWLKNWCSLIPCSLWDFVIFGGTRGSLSISFENIKHVDGVMCNSLLLAKLLLHLQLSYILLIYLQGCRYVIFSLSKNYHNWVMHHCRHVPENEIHPSPNNTNQTTPLSSKQMDVLLKYADVDRV
jgi:hypothetical protein